jgi:nitrogen fixation/metabolism regulation signal transduction histidine kinase
MWIQKDIEEALEIGVEYAPEDIHQTKVKEALKGYRQLKALKKPVKQQIISFSILLAWCVFFISIIIGILFIKWLIKPLKILTSATRAVSRSNLLTGLEPKGPLEVKRLIRAFNQMTNSLHANQEEIRRIIRRITWQKASDMVSREIKKPLTPTRLLLDRLVKKYKDRVPEIEEILEEASRFLIDEMTNLTKEFSQLASAEITQAFHNIIPLIEEVLEDYSTSYPGINFRLKFGKNIPRVLIDWKAMKMVLVSVIQYRIDAMHGVGELEVGCYSPENKVLIEISDVGDKSCENEITKVLSIPKEIIKFHEGDIIIEVKNGKNMLKIVLPNTE